jgi:hypothetical protein
MYLIDGTLRVIPPGASLAPSTKRYRETLREGPDSAGGVTMNVHTASVTAASCSASQTRLCDLVTRSIEYLEDLKPSPLRDALLARLRSLQTRYCTSC